MKTLYPLTFQRVPLGLVIRNVPISNAPIKGEMSREPGERLAPAFSASGQDVWMPEELAQLNNPALVISAVGARCGKVFKQESNEPWGVVANTAVYSPGENSDLTFLWYQVNDENFWVRGGSAQPYVQFDRSLQQRIFLPPLETQQRIANYLDRETAEIDAAVADLDRYVELLEKRRRRVVIQGFNDPKYNPVSQRLKFLTASEDHRRIPIKSGDRVDMAGEFPYYGASGIIDYVNDYLWDNEERLLLSEDGANLVMRNHPVAFVADGQYWVNNHAHVLKCRGETPPELVAKAIEVTSIAHLITGSAQPKLTAAAMGEIEFLFPLSVPDQKALLADLQPEMEEIDALIAESTKLRDLLLKRRSVLITDVVTGRKQV